MNRREWMKTAAAGLCFSSVARSAPGGRVSVARCPDYGSELLPAMERMFDQIGGLGALVKGKTVAVKVNLTGSPTYRLGHYPLGVTHHTHPAVIGATVHLLGRAGARRIRLLECPWSTAEPLEEVMLQANWDPRDFLSAAGGVEFENTNWLGYGRSYSRFPVPNGGHMFKAFDLNHSYEDCDVFVSLAKMKDHATAGVTLAMKNCFGITPCTIYGSGSPENEPGEVPKGGRNMFHTGDRQPAKPAPPENDPASPRDGGYRVPRVVADIVAARPIHLSIVEAVETMTGGEGPWVRGPLEVVKPGLIVAGTNCVATDAACMVLMGYDPMADRGKAPFEQCDSTLRLAEELGVGSRDLSQSEVAGVPLGEAVFPFRRKR